MDARTCGLIRCFVVELCMTSIARRSLTVKLQASGYSRGSSQKSKFPKHSATRNSCWPAQPRHCRSITNTGSYTVLQPTIIYSASGGGVPCPLIIMIVTIQMANEEDSRPYGRQLQVLVWI